MKYYATVIDNNIVEVIKANKRPNACAKEIKVNEYRKDALKYTNGEIVIDMNMLDQVRKQAYELSKPK